MEFVVGAAAECAFNRTGHLKVVDDVVCSDDKTLAKMSGERKSRFSAHEKKAIIEAAKEKSNCSSEWCVVEKLVAMGILGQSALDNFKKKGPVGSEWFSNSNIDLILADLEKMYKNFFHIPFQMRDFEENKETDEEVKQLKATMSGHALDKRLARNLGNVDFVDLHRKGYRRFGVIFNTDVSTGPGQHWFCSFIDTTSAPFSVEYFNSSGDPPLAEIEIWINHVKNELMEKLNTTTVIKYNEIVHQRDTHSCGPYSVYYIMSRLAGVPAENMLKRKLNDEILHKFRYYVFRPPEEGIPDHLVGKKVGPPVAAPVAAPVAGGEQ